VKWRGGGKKKKEEGKEEGGDRGWQEGGGLGGRSGEGKEEGLREGGWFFFGARGEGSRRGEYWGGLGWKPSKGGLFKGFERFRGEPRGEKGVDAGSLERGGFLKLSLVWGGRGGGVPLRVGGGGGTGMPRRASSRSGGWGRDFHR